MFPTHTPHTTQFHTLCQHPMHGPTLVLLAEETEDYSKAHASVGSSTHGLFSWVRAEGESLGQNRCKIVSDRGVFRTHCPHRPVTLITVVEQFECKVEFTWADIQKRHPNVVQRIVHFLHEALRATSFFEHVGLASEDAAMRARGPAIAVSGCLPT